jgi:hypothetical protein
MAFNEHTSQRLASLASKVLSDPTSSPEARELAACALTQAPDHNQNAMMAYRSYWNLQNALVQRRLPTVIG